MDGFIREGSVWKSEIGRRGERLMGFPIGVATFANDCEPGCVQAKDWDFVLERIKIQDDRMLDD